MNFDVIVAAFKEHKEGVEMTKRMWIGTVLVIVLLAGVAGVVTLWDQSKGDVMISVTKDTNDDDAMTISVWSASESRFSWTGTGSDGFAEAMRQAVKEGAVDEVVADGIVLFLSLDYPQ